MKKLAFLILFYFLLLCGCTFETSSYQFVNGIENVSSIVILQNQNENGEGTDESKIYVVRELEENEIGAFMSEVYQLQTDRRAGGPLWGYGEYIAKITYTNGDVEMLGTLNIEFIPNGTQPTGFGAYYFVDNSLWSVISKYI